jgi:hypothetical protein
MMARGMDSGSLQASSMGIRDGGVQAAFLTVIGLDLVLVAGSALSYRPFFSQPESLSYLAKPVALLLLYATAVVIVTRSQHPAQRRGLRVAAVIGCACGLVEMVNISVETFGDLAGGAKLVATAPLILGPFVAWGIVGGWAAHATGSLRQGVLAAVWSAMVTMAVGVTFGFALASAARGRMEQILGADPDFIRTGWTDLQAFVLANTFDNGFTHLLGALIVGTVVGLTGSVVGLRWARYKRAR